MTNKHIIEVPDLNARIEQVIAEHIAACRAAAISAVELAFATNAISAFKSDRSRQTRRPSTGRAETPTSRESLARRTPAEMAAVSERLYQAVCARPGESKAALAAEVGLSARELDRPMTHLKDSGKVRSVGQRHLARYFPLVRIEAAGAA